MTELNSPSNPQQIKCPHCGQTYAVRPEQWEQYHGRTINCTRCAQPFTVTAPPGAVAQPPATPPTQQPPAYGSPSAMGAQSPMGYPPMGTPMGQPAMGGYGSPYPAYAAPGVAPGTSGWAITSLVAGIVSVVLFCVPFFSLLVGLTGVFGGILGLKRTANNRTGGRGLAIAGLITGGFGALLGILVIIPFLAGSSAFLPALANAREAANRVKCAGNMKQLYTAMVMYANNNNGAFPNKLEDVLTADPTLDRNAFICPDDDKAPPSASNAQTAAHEIASGKNSSYLYVGEGLTTSASADTVLLYEPLGLHKKHNPGMNVLFADGHVEFVKEADAKTILDQQAAGTKPIKVTVGP
jgi:prepilin-type processing-associated H-X9-DG protein